METAVPPTVRNLEVTPALVQFEDVSDDGQTATFTVTARAEVEGDVAEVRVLVQPQASFDLAAEATLDVPGPGSIEQQVEVTLPRDQAGLLSVLVVAVGPDGQTANEARGTLLVERPNAPPTIDAVDGPETFTPPGLLRFNVRASDPDGINDLLKVEVLTPAGDRLDLFLEAEGRYSVSFDVPEGVETGPQTFEFVATDRAGAESARVPFTVTINE